MMLDMKRTFDDIVLTHASRERAEALLANPFYQSLSSSFAGTQEYMAMEKLGQLQATENGISLSWTPRPPGLRWTSWMLRSGSARFSTAACYACCSSPRKRAGVPT